MPIIKELDRFILLLGMVFPVSYTQTDLITATSRFSHITLSGMFSVDPHKVKETGYPRNDMMFNNNSKQKLKELLDTDIS